MVYLCLGELCYINVDTGNSSYTDPSALPVDAAGSSHGSVVCSITLTNPVKYLNHSLLNTESVISQGDDDGVDDDDDDGMVLVIPLDLLSVLYRQLCRI